MKLIRAWQRLNLWPRLVIGVTFVFLVLFGIFSLISLRAVSDSTDRILQERLVIAQMAAREIDRLVERGFYELEKATEFAPFDPSAPSLGEEYHMLAHAYGRVGTLSLGVYFLDAQGIVVLSQPTDKLLTGTDLSSEPHIKWVRETRTQSVSHPFVDPATGVPAVALTIPIFGDDGTLVSMLTGLVNVTDVEVMDPLRHARNLGDTGHAELVDSRGLIIASTDYGGFLQPGEHLGFYLKMLREGKAGVESVPYIPWHAAAGSGSGEHHVMAFAPISAAPWGIAVGGTDRETFAPVSRLRRNLLLSGALSLAFLWALTLVGAHLLVRPVRTLAGAAQHMAGGDLEQPIEVGEGGEISVLGNSLETMRVQLRTSLDEVRRWGEELEVKVSDRTSELGARNRQLAAVTAVAVAANQSRDLEGLLEQCLDVVLEHTQVDAAAIRLVSDSGSQLTVASAQGDFSDFPCQGRAIGLDECPCGYVAANGSPLYLGLQERQLFQPPCHAPNSYGVAVLPLRSPKGVLGVLYLSTGSGEASAPEERSPWDKIADRFPRAGGQLSRGGTCGLPLLLASPAPLSWGVS